MTRRFDPLRWASLAVPALAAVALLAYLREERPAAGAPPASEARRPQTHPLGARIERAQPEGRVQELAPAAPLGEDVEARPLGVDLVRAETGAPVPDADVWCWPRTPVLGSEGDFEEWLRSCRIEAQLAHAQRSRADRDGHVEVARPPQGFVIVAAVGELWGCASFTGLDAGPARVELARDVDLRVQVVDAQGAVVGGLPVALREHRGGGSYDRLLARTDSTQGIAVLRHAGHFLRTLRGEGGEFLVAVQELLDPPLELRLSPDAPPTEPIHFVLEASGSCRVTLVDDSGEPVGGALDARLRFADGPAGEARHARGGELVFEHVALGRTLVVEARREGSDARLEAHAAGPRQPGERVELRLQLEPGVAVLRGRALDGAGAPLHERELCARGETGASRVWTSSAGRFALPLELAAELPEPAALELRALAPDGSAEAAGSLALPGELRAGSNEVGDCVFAEMPLLAEGHVVDEAGRPVAGALVRSGAGAAAVRADASGAFALRGDAEGDVLALHAESEGLAGSALRVRPPARDVRLVLGACGGLAGRVLLDPSLQQSLILALVTRAGDSAGDASAVLAADGQFTLGELAPGSYSLRLVYAADASELGALAGLSVRAGATTHDPRLSPLDLRARQRLLELELVDERGRAIPHARAYSRPSGEADARWSFAEPSAAGLRLLCDGRALDVSLAADGYLCCELEHVSASRRVTLQPAAQLSLELVAGLALPEPPLCVGVELRPLDTGRSCGFAEPRQVFFGQGGVLSCSSAHAGALRAEIVVQRRGPRAGPLVRVAEPLPRILQVATTSARQVFALRVDPAALAAALETARGTD